MNKEEEYEQLPPTWEATARIFLAQETVPESHREELINMGIILDGVLKVFKNQHDDAVSSYNRGVHEIAKLLMVAREKN